MDLHLRLQGLGKIFGPDPASALRALREGASRADLLERQQVVGVHDASLEIERGELFVIMGLSGSGKSTLLRMINRLIEPDTGKVFLGDTEVTALPARELVQLRRHGMSMVFQSFALLPHLSVLDNVAFGLRIAGVPAARARRQSLEVLELTGIADVAGQYPRQLSGGMQQRVGLARAWVTEPELLLMDEAFSALDPLIRTEMQDALLALQRNSGRTTVFVSHDLGEAVRIADRIAVMAEGEIRQVARPVEIIRSPADDYVRAFFRDVRPDRLFCAGDIAVGGVTDSTDEPVPARTSLEELLPRAAASDRPIPVAGEDGAIVGHIDRQRLLQALSGELSR